MKLWCVKILRAIISGVPFYFITSRQSSPAFSAAQAPRHSRTSHAPFCPHKGLLSFNLHFFPFYVLPCVIGFFACIVLQRRSVHSRDARCRVIAVMSLSMQSCCRAGPWSSFTIYTTWKPVWGKSLVTCCKITGIVLINESLELSLLRLSWAKNAASHLERKYLINQTVFPMLSPFTVPLVQ